jgi:hypothetical protein
LLSLLFMAAASVVIHRIVDAVEWPDALKMRE